MVVIPEPARKRFRKHLGKAQSNISLAINNHADESESLQSILIQILRDVFGFNEIEKLVDLSTSEMKNYLGAKSDDETKYIVDISFPRTNIPSEISSNTVEYAKRNHVQWLVKTNGIVWDIYKNNCEQPGTYGKLYSMNFLKLNLDNNEDLANLFVFCKESHSKNIITDSHNRNRWYGYLNKDRTSIDYMFLVNVCLYDDGSEKVYIPLLDLTYWCDEPFIARRNAEKSIEKYLKDECEIGFDSKHKFETVAYHKETIHLKKNIPVWW